MQKDRRREDWMPNSERVGFLNYNFCKFTSSDRQGRDAEERCSYPACG